MNSAWKIEFDPRAGAEFAKLDKAIQRRIVKLQDNPRRHGVVLQGETLRDYWKYCIGDYRLIADILDNALTALLVAVGHRHAYTDRQQKTYHKAAYFRIMTG